MRILIFLCFLFTTTAIWSQNSGNNRVTERKLSVCHITDSKRKELQNVVRVLQEIEGISVRAFFDCDLGMVDECESGTLGAYTRNSIKVGEQTLSVGNKLGLTDITQYMPVRLIHVKANKEIFIVIEMNNVSHTSVGGGYYYIAAKITDGVATLHKIDTPCNKEPFRNVELVMKLMKK